MALAPAKKKILLIRLDKIGDLVCTMCVDQIPAMQDFDAHWVIAKGLSFIPDHAWPRRNFSEFAKDEKAFESFYNFVKDLKPDIAVSFQCPWWINYALWKARVPVRAGVRSQWHSYLFLNKGLRQKRSRSIKHEADYNRELLEYALGVKSNSDQKISLTPILKLKAKENPELLARDSLIAQKYVVVHPGMAGSALNWPSREYIQYIERLLPNEKIVLTGTTADELWLKDLKKAFDKNPQVVSLQNKLSAPELLTILEKAKGVLVPSTGVAHLAASLGTRVIALYSPLRVQHPIRWAARGEHVQIFLINEVTADQLPLF